MLFFIISRVYLSISFYILQLYHSVFQPLLKNLSAHYIPVEEPYIVLWENDSI